MTWGKWVGVALLGVGIVLIGFSLLFSGNPEEDMPPGWEPLNAALQTFMDEQQARQAALATLEERTGDDGASDRSVDDGASGRNEANAAPQNSDVARNNDSDLGDAHVAAVPADAPHDNSDHIGKININTATAEMLQELPGIGAARAELIIQYRKDKGTFNKVADLLEIRGIGEKMLAKITPLVVVE
jgi:competence protein ComEA